MSGVGAPLHPGPLVDAVTPPEAPPGGGAAVPGRRLHRLPPDSDVVELLTVGIDVGSATFHVSVSRVVLERRALALSTRFDVVTRETVVASPVAFTPYLASNDIDAVAVDAAVRRAYAEGGVDPEEIDSGVVLLTGSALLRHNARALAERLAGTSGRFVCAAAGHHFEAALAAHGSGAVARSLETADPVVALDIGGATTKLALVCGGDVRATAAIGVGSRLLAWGPDRRLNRVESTAVPLAESLGVAARLGDTIDASQVDAICEAMALAVVGQLDPGIFGKADLPAPYLTLGLTDVFPAPARPFEIVASGGVAEFLADPNARGDAHDVGDLGPDLARAILSRLEREGLARALRTGLQRIRATVIGASQFSTQVSGSTIAVDRGALPLHHVPVVRPRIDLACPTGVDSRAVEEALACVVSQRFAESGVPDTVAVSLGWGGAPTHARLRALAEGLVAGQRAAGVARLVVALDADVASSVGRIATTELGVAAGTLLCLDNLDLADLDYVDMGRPVEPAKVVPVVVKSLLFGGAGARTAEATVRD